MGCPPSGSPVGKLLAGEQSVSVPHYGRFDPQFPQKAPVFCAPHEHVHVSASGFFDPQLLQNLPLFSEPQLGQYHLVGAGAGAGV